MGRMALMTVAAALALGAGPGWAQDGRLTVELNKVEPGDTGGCRAFFLFRNRTAQTLDGFEMSLAILNASGVIDQLLTIDAAPLPAGRTTLKLFEIPGASCDGISEILLHDIATCQAGGEDADCFAMVDLVSRADIGLTK